ncbi:MAG: ORF6N domain-containing protein [bacterium]
MNQPVKLETVQDKIIDVRREKVILDSDVAALYGVETKEINQAVSNNPDKFPKGYIFKLTKNEKQEVVKNFDHLGKLKFSPYLPTAFTEKGLYMLATIIKGPKAVKTTLDIIETYARIKDLSRSISKLPTANETEKKRIGEKAARVIGDIIMTGSDELQTTGSETSFKMSLGFIEFKHTVKKGKKGK